MGQLIDGVWHADDDFPKDASGRFVRPDSPLRHWVTPDGAAGPTGAGGFKAEAGRYHLYVSLACPWAHRTMLFRKFKGLEGAISLSVVHWYMGRDGWTFADGPGVVSDPIFSARFLREIYLGSDPKHTGRVTVPVLFDKRSMRIVNNESADILRMFNSGFGGLADDSLDLYPADLRAEIDALGEWMYPRLNNGVYRAGFATTQIAYDEAFADVFAALDELEPKLRKGPLLFGGRVTEADIRLFVTLVRFDAAYHGLFKCNLRRIADYPGLSRHIEAMLAVPGVRATVSVDHIKRGYYAIKALNPSGIVPLGPELPWLAPRSRQ